jgi:hypothetical protein
VARQRPPPRAGAAGVGRLGDGVARTGGGRRRDLVEPDAPSQERDPGNHCGPRERRRQLPFVPFAAHGPVRLRPGPRRRRRLWFLAFDVPHLAAGGGGPPQDPGSPTAAGSAS